MFCVIGGRPSVERVSVAHPVRTTHVSVDGGVSQVVKPEVTSAGSVLRGMNRSAIRRASTSQDVASSPTINSAPATLQHSLSTPHTLNLAAAADLKLPKSRPIGGRVVRPFLQDVPVTTVTPSHPAVQQTSTDSLSPTNPAALRGMPKGSPRAASFHMAHNRLMMRQQMTSDHSSTVPPIPVTLLDASTAIEEHKIQQLKSVRYQYKRIRLINLFKKNSILLFVESVFCV